MATLHIKPGRPLQGETTVPGDKSLSHRTLMLGGIAHGETQVRGWLPAGDTLATLESVQKLGVQITRHDATTLTIHGGGFSAPSDPLDFVNAGTGIRLMAGLLAGQAFPSILDGSEQLRRRPMKRITEPLQLMGADITSTDGYAPLTIQPADLHGIRFEQPIPSAQVKSAILLAGLNANSPTTVVEAAGPGRDHTERMLKAMGATIQVDGATITLEPTDSLHALDFVIPGDFSSAAFLIGAALITPQSEIRLTGVNTNTRRTGLLDVLAQMGASIPCDDERMEGGEPVADMVITQQGLQGASINGEVVVRMIDEFPVLMVLATQAEGETVVSDAAELRVKETDRIAVMANELRKMGATIQEEADGFVVSGVQRLRGATVDAHDDHRIGMSLAVAALVAEGETTLLDASCIHDSFPGFEDVLAKLGAQVSWQT